MSTQAIKRRFFRGFSLLEVMVAFAILAISFVSLILVQARATNLAIKSQELSIATQLARMQLLECSREAQKNLSAVSDFKEEGDFSEQGYEGIKWECHAPKFNMKPPSASEVESNFKKKAEENKKDVGASGSVSAPFIGMITDTLGNSVRELVLIVRFGENAQEEMRVVTHIVDLTAMAGLARILNEGAKMFEKNFSQKKPDDPKTGGENPPLRPPPPPQMPGRPQ